MFVALPQHRAAAFTHQSATHPAQCFSIEKPVFLDKNEFIVSDYPNINSP